MQKKASGVILDADYRTDAEERAYIILYLRTSEGIEVFEDRDFLPYFYVVCKDAAKVKAAIEKAAFGEEGVKAVSVKEAKTENAEKMLKVYFSNPAHLSVARGEIEKVTGVIERREYDIPFAHRYLIDKGISPMDRAEILLSEGKIKAIKELSGNLKEKPLMAAFDLETMSRKNIFSDPKKDEIITIAYKGTKKEKVFCYAEEAKGIKGAVVCGNEKETIEGFINEVKEASPDVIVTYNGDSFDFPYLTERAEKYGLELDFGFGKPRTRKKGLYNAIKLSGMQHVDAYQIVRMLGRIGAIHALKFDLESVCLAVFGRKKEKVPAEEIASIWKNRKNMKRLIDYNIEDAEVTYRIADEFLPLFIELSRLSGMSLYESTRAMSSQLVEALLIKESHRRGQILPNKPSQADVRQRMMQTYKGGYVKEPVAGLHENIAILDFRSLHPSIMIAHNISPETLKCDHGECREKNTSPDRDWFCKKRSGFIPKVLEEVLSKRIKVKELMEKTDKKSLEYRMLDARQHALKILLNATYGTLGYARFRWYSRECARAITAWSRHYINETFRKAEEAGLKPLYGDTDSAFLAVPEGKREKDIINFVEKINTELPGAMELEFEGLYRRGVFVTKKEGGAAKKRYALVDYEGNIKIVGFEYVRRDWANIAKDTQRAVIEAVLKEGDSGKAAEIVRKKIKLLKSGKAPKKDLVIMTQLQKDVKSYESDAPHVSAVRKAMARGNELAVGVLVSYVITKKGKSISNRAELEEYVKEGDYDADYYVENQLLPAVMRIMAELGYSREDLLTGGKQAKLFSF
jgi:DNA polymerase I